jgi:hypothetical protein
MVECVENSFPWQVSCKIFKQRFMGDCCRVSSVVDPHHVDADADSPYHPDADPGSDFYLVRMQIQIWIFN